MRPYWDVYLEETGEKVKTLTPAQLLEEYNKWLTAKQNAQSESDITPKLPEIERLERLERQMRTMVEAVRHLKTHTHHGESGLPTVFLTNA